MFSLLVKTKAIVQQSLEKERVVAMVSDVVECGNETNEKLPIVKKKWLRKAQETCLRLPTRLWIGEAFLVPGCRPIWAPSP